MPIDKFYESGLYYYRKIIRKGTLKLCRMERNPVIENRTINGKEFLYFIFKGRLTVNDAQKAVIDWKKALENCKDMHPHVWNCTEMTGYEPMARIVWQKAIKELKGKIDKIWLISDSSIIIAGAKILSIFTSFDICTVRSENDITENDTKIASPI